VTQILPAVYLGVKIRFVPIQVLGHILLMCIYVLMPFRDLRNVSIELDLYSDEDIHKRTQQMSLNPTFSTLLDSTKESVTSSQFSAVSSLALSGRCSQRTEEMSLGGRFLCPPLAPAA
jgi:hypothetical protein